MKPHLDLMKTAPNMPMKLYCDAGKEPHALSYGCGWALCDHMGRVQEIASCNLSIKQDTVGAECQAIERGIDIVAQYDQIQHIIVYSDCLPAVHWARDQRDELFENVTSGSVEPIPREDNQIADLVASNAVDTGDPPNQQPYAVTD